MPGAAIEFRDVSFARPSRPRVLDHFSLAVGAGEVLALVGRSGAGKSTLLKLVNRLLLPVSGAVIVEDRDTRDWDPIRLRRRIGYVLHDGRVERRRRAAARALGGGSCGSAHDGAARPRRTSDRAVRDRVAR
ncbi:MAG: hypothetical protein DMG00_28870 [Acidobacteria bacterium]|nr:MAG: hypothetical protein DMG00_28870 [Acidobacteriota bacterium]